MPRDFFLEWVSGLPCRITSLLIARMCQRANKIMVMGWVHPWVGLDWANSDFALFEPTVCKYTKLIAMITYM